MEQFQPRDGGKIRTFSFFPSSCSLLPVPLNISIYGKTWNPFQLISAPEEEMTLLLIKHFQRLPKK